MLLVYAEYNRKITNITLLKPNIMHAKNMYELDGNLPFHLRFLVFGKFRGV